MCDASRCLWSTQRRIETFYLRFFFLCVCPFHCRVIQKPVTLLILYCSHHSVLNVLFLQWNTKPKILIIILSFSESWSSNIWSLSFRVLKWGCSCGSCFLANWLLCQLPDWQNGRIDDRSAAWTPVDRFNFSDGLRDIDNCKWADGSNYRY